MQKDTGPRSPGEVEVDHMSLRTLDSGSSHTWSKTHPWSFQLQEQRDSLCCLSLFQLEFSQGRGGEQALKRRGLFAAVKAGLPMADPLLWNRQIQVPVVKSHL